MADRRYQRKDAMGRKVQVSQRSTMMHGGSHSRTQNPNRTGRSVNRNRVISRRPVSGNNVNMRPPVGFTLQEYDHLVPAAVNECPQLGASFGYDAADVLVDFCPQTPAVRQLRGQLEKDMNTGGDMIMWYFIWCLCCIAGTCPSECSRCPKRKREERENRER